MEEDLIKLYCKLVDLGMELQDGGVYLADLEDVISESSSSSFKPLTSRVNYELMIDDRNQLGIQSTDTPIGEPVSAELGSNEPRPVADILTDLASGNIGYTTYNGSIDGHVVGRYVRGLKDTPFEATTFLGGGNDNLALRLVGEVDGHDRPVIKIGEGSGPKGYQGTRPYDAPILARGTFPIEEPSFDGPTEGYWYIQPYSDIKVSWDDFRAFRDGLNAMGVKTVGTDLGYPDVGQVGYDENGDVKLLDYNAVGDPWGTDYGDPRPGPTIPQPDSPSTAPNEHVW